VNGGKEREKQEQATGECEKKMMAQHSTARIGVVADAFRLSCFCDVFCVRVVVHAAAWHAASFLPADLFCRSCVICGNLFFFSTLGQRVWRQGWFLLTNRVRMKPPTNKNHLIFVPN